MIQFRKYLLKSGDKGKWFLLSVIISITGACFYLNSVELQYFSKITLKFERKKTGVESPLADLNNLGVGLGNVDELEIEKVVLKSRPLLMNVVKNLNLNVQFFNLGEITNSELFANAPFSVLLVKYDEAKKNVSSEYIIEIDESDNFRLINNKNEIFAGKFGKLCQYDLGTIILKKKGKVCKSRYKVVIWNPIEIVKELERNIVVNIAFPNSLLLDISLIGSAPEKSEAILNEITKEYNIIDLKDKNVKAQNVEEFIKDHLIKVKKDLFIIEGKKADFQREHSIIDFEELGRITLQNSNDISRQLFQKKQELNVINSLELGILEIANNGLLPSNFKISSSLNFLIEEYNNLIISRNRMLLQATAANPSVLELNKRIATLKEGIVKGIQQHKSIIKSSINDLEHQLLLDRKVVNKIPTESKMYRSIKRQQDLTEKFYLFLLQKIEDNALNFALEVPKARIINPAYTVYPPVSPNGKMIFLCALIGGIMLPFAFFYIKFLYDDHIYDKEDILAHSPFSVLGEMPEIGNNMLHLVQKKEFLQLNDRFKHLVTYLKFMHPNKRGAKVILVSSSVRGEGKTLLSVNLALTLADKNARTLLVGADLRNPQMKIHGIDHQIKKGLSEYLSYEHTDLDQLLHTCKENSYCDIIYSGSIKDNPNELFENGRFDGLIRELSSKYAFIIIDSAPLMLVSDTLSISNIADTVLYVLRSGFTKSFMIEFANNIAINLKLKNFTFVINRF